MELELSLHERFLLENWLPKESEPGEDQVDARSLLTSDQTLEPTEVRDRLGKVRKCLGDLKTRRSMIEVRPPMGRGFSSRLPGDTVLTWLSPWEEAWLIVDQVKSEGRLDRPEIAAKELQERLNATVVNAVAIAVLCLATPAEGQQLAKGVAAGREHTAQDRVWLRWLAGDNQVDLASNLTDEVLGETPKKALLAALQRRWPDVEKLLPKKLQKPFPKAMKPSGTGMDGQFLAQLTSHTLRKEPSRQVIETSLSALFGFFGVDSNSQWWNGREVSSLLPLLALYGRELEPTLGGAAVLHARRAVNPHLVEPPASTFSGPPAVVAALEKLEGILARAAQDGKDFEISLTEEGNVYRVR